MHMHHLCRYTSFVERPDSRERAKHHSLSEISDLPSAIKGIVHPKKKNVIIYSSLRCSLCQAPKTTIRLVHITCAL